jgi:IclR family transcriptional regulator, pca regulon regulatory protein
VTELKADAARPDGGERRETMEGLAKGLAILESFSEFNGRLTLSEAAKATNLTRATARRCLLTLVEHGYIASDGRYFTPLPRLLKLGYAFLSATPLARLSEPVLQALQVEAEEAISLSILDQTDVVFIARSAPRRMNTLGPSVGSRLPLWCSASGRILLSGMDERAVKKLLGDISIEKRTAKTIVSITGLMERVRQAKADEYAIVDEELELGMRSLAVPVKDLEGSIVAALSLSVNAAKTSVDKMRKTLLPILRSGAKRLSI